MRIIYHLDDGNDKITNFKVAEAIVDLCNDEHESCNELDAEIVAKMILLQTDTKKGGVQE
jgi:hypothetical protein